MAAERTKLTHKLGKYMLPPITRNDRLPTMANELFHELQSGRYGNPLKQFQRDAMLDLILAWGTLDGGLTILLAAFTREELHDAAERIGKIKGGIKLLEIARMISDHGQSPNIARKFKKIKKNYEKHSKCRDRIEHEHCVGYLLTEEQYIVFAVAERQGGDQMVIEAIPVEDIQAATNFGNTLVAFAVNSPA